MEPALQLQSPGKLGIGQGIQKADHGDGNGHILDTADHRLGHGILFLIESDDEARVHKDAGPIDLVDAFGKIPPGVLFFIDAHKRLGIRSLDTGENGEKSGVAHQRQGFVAVRQVQTRFGRKREGTALALVPIAKRFQERPHGFRVADEVVVDDVHMPAVAERVKGVQFTQHLFGCLEAGGSSVQLDDIAELTVERTTPRVLHPYMHVMLEFEKVETGHR